MKAALIKQTGLFGMENRFGEQISKPILDYSISTYNWGEFQMIFSEQVFIKIKFAQPDLTEPWTPYVTADQMLECKPVKFNADILKTAVGEKLCQLTGHVGRFCREGMGFTRNSLETRKLGRFNCGGHVFRGNLRLAVL